MKNCIYIIRFKGCKRVYIGQTIAPKNRFKYHRSELRAQRHCNTKLQRAYNKYGVDNMIIQVLESVEDSTKLNERELYYINLFNSFKGGLNCNSGGDYILVKSTKKIYQYDASTGHLIGFYYGYANTGRVLGIGESNIRQCCRGDLKTVKGFHFSLTEKTPQMVLKDVVNKTKSDEYKLNHSRLFSGEKNPMYGKKRPELSGENNPYAKLIKSGYKPKRKIKLSYDKIIKLYNQGLTQKQIAEKAKCTQVQISTILRNNGIRKFKRSD
jgi:predicted GIY-YIG superfamily endonuclease